MQNEYIFTSGPCLGSVLSGPVLALGLFGLAQCWSWVCSVWPRHWVFSVWPSVGLGSVQSGPVLALGLFGLAQCWPWVCLVWPRSWVFSVWARVDLGSVSSGPVLALGLFGLTQGDQGLLCLPIPEFCLNNPFRDPSPSGQYLSWVADFILGSSPLTIAVKIHSFTAFDRKIM